MVGCHVMWQPIFYEKLHRSYIADIWIIHSTFIIVLQAKHITEECKNGEENY